MKLIEQREKLYFIAIIACILSFAFPSISIELGGKMFTLYFAGTYAGKLVIVILIVLGVFVQIIFFYRTKSTSAWLALVCGAYATLYASHHLWKCLVRFKTDNATTLANTLKAAGTPKIGLWLLLVAGIFITATAAIKISSRSLSQKKLAVTSY